MTSEEAFNVISKISPCWDCRYKNSSCNRQTSHVWSDGICHEFDEALETLASVLFPNQSDPEPQGEG